MLRGPLKWLLAAAVLCSVSAEASARQAGEETEKRAAVRRLLELAGPAAQGHFVFERLLREYQTAWTEGAVADMRAKGFFARLPPRQAARMEQLVREFGGSAFGEIKRRVTAEMGAPGGYERIAAPAFDRHLTLGEIDELNTMLQTPAGRKFVAVYPKVLAEGAVVTLRAGGLFSQSSPEAATAKAEQFNRDMKGDPSREFQRYLTAAGPQLRAQFSDEEFGELLAFYQTPTGRKLSEVGPRLLEEIMRGYYAEMAPRLSAVIEEVLRAEFEEFKERAAEVLRQSAPPRRQRRAGN